MAKNKDPKKINFNELKPDELLKYEIASELGLFDKVMNDGWKSLSAKDTGRIGGIMTKRKRQMKKESMNNETMNNETMNNETMNNETMNNESIDNEAMNNS